MSNWTTPKQDWQLSDLVTAQQLNDIGGNLAYLKEKTPRGKENITSTSTNAGSFVALKRISLTTRGGDVWVAFYCPVWHDNGGTVYFDIGLDGTRQAFNGNNGSLELD